MFYTHPDAEFALPPALSPFGERSWHWVEFSLQIPYYFLSVSVATEDGSFRRHFLFSQLRDVLGLIAASKDGFKEIDIALLSPGHMNGSSSYMLGRVKEIWERRGGHEQMFVMSDGATLHFPPDGDNKNSREMELVFTL